MLVSFDNDFRIEYNPVKFMGREVERTREGATSGGESRSPIASRSGAEGSQPPKSRRYNDTIARILLPTYIDIAGRIRSLGLGTVSVTQAEEQVTSMGIPVPAGSHLVVATFEGTERDFESFRGIAYGVHPILHPITGKRPFPEGSEEETQAVEAAIQKGLESLAASKRISDAVIASLRTPKPQP